MALDKFRIGMRIRYIREHTFNETRALFSVRCDLTESHLGQIERGEILPSISALDKIATNCGVDLNFILYGNPKTVSTRNNIDFFLNRSNQDELKMYFECISSIKKYIYSENKQKNIC